MPDPTHRWYTLVAWSDNWRPLLPQGPWASRRDAQAALARWAARAGARAQVLVSATWVRVAGPYHTQREALEADLPRTRFLERGPLIPFGQIVGPQAPQGSAEDARHRARYRARLKAEKGPVTPAGDPVTGRARARGDARTDAACALLLRPEMQLALVSKPHPSAWLASEGLTCLDWAAYVLERGGRAGWVRVARVVESVARARRPARVTA
jgi:hypothetical protein